MVAKIQEKLRKNGVENDTKIKLKRWSVVIFYTFSDFRLGSLVESILDDLGIDLGRLWHDFSNIFEKNASEK